MLEKYITPVLMYYLDKYVKNIDPKDLQLSFWGGDAVLKNLKMRCDVLEKELSHQPFVITSGKVQELVIHVPWTTIGSEAVEITANGVECTGRFKTGEHSNAPDETDTLSFNLEAGGVATSLPSKQEELSKPPQSGTGYLQGLLSRIVNNVIFHVKNMTLKITEVDVCLTFHIKGLDVYNTDQHWHKSFLYTDYLQGDYGIRKQCSVSDVYLTLDQLDGSGEVEYYEDPFTSSFAFIVRVMLTYEQNILKSNRIECYCTAVDFFATPTQFSMFLQLLDRLLEVYYMSKNHRMRTEVVSSSSVEDDKSGPTPSFPPTDDTPQHVEDEEPELLSSSMKVDHDSPVDRKEVSPPDTSSWSSWAWSFVVSEGDPNKEKLEESEHKDTIGALSSPPQSDPPAVHMLLLIDEATVTIKAVQNPPAQAFFSKKKPQSSPAMRVVFKGCHGRFSVDSKSKFFGVYQGFMGVEAYIIGKCMCSKFGDSSSKQSFTSLDSGMQHLENVTESLVFRMGEREIASCLLQGTLFDTKMTTQMMSNDIQAELCPSEVFSAFWFFYDYFDAGEEREREECTEGLRIGSVEGLFCAEVFHCLRELYTRVGKSLEVSPWRSTKYVVIGDPEAKTRVLFDLNPILVTVPVFAHNTPSSGAQDSVAKCMGSHVVFTCDGCHVDGTIAMYSGNASEDHIQHTSLQGKIPKLSVVAGREASIGDVEPIMSFSGFSLQYHSQDSGASSGRSYVQFGAERTALLLQIPDTYVAAAILLSWNQPCDAECTMPDVAPTPRTASSETISSRKSSELWVKLCSENSMIELNRGSDYQSYTAVVGQIDGWLHRASVASGDKPTPLMFGPVKSDKISTTQKFKEFASSESREYLESDSVAECFLSIPVNHQDCRFSTLEIKTSGVLFLATSEVLTLTSEIMQSFSDLLSASPEPHDGEGEEPPSPPPLVEEHQPMLGAFGGSVINTKLPSELEEIEDTKETEEKQSSPPPTEVEHADDDQEQVKSWFELLESVVMEISTKPVCAIFTTNLGNTWGSSPIEWNSPDSNLAIIRCFQSVSASVCGGQRSSTEFSCSPQALVLCWPEIQLVSSLIESVSISEPVPKGALQNSLPWQVKVSELALYTFDNGMGSNILGGMACDGTIATTSLSKMANSSVNIHLNFLPVVVGISRQQVELISSAVSAAFCAFLLPRTPPLQDRKHSHTKLDSGMGTLSTSITAESPGHSVVSLATLPHLESYSGTTSSVCQKDEDKKSPSLLLWLQGAVPKVTLKVYGEQDHKLIKFEVSGEDLVMSWDQQSTSSEGKLSLTSLEALLFKRSHHDEGWEPFALEETVFSSRVSVLGKELSSTIAMEMSKLNAAASSNTQRSSGVLHFISAKYKTYREISHKSPIISLSVQPFEGMFLPKAFDLFIDLSNGLQPFYELASITQPKKEVAPGKEKSPPKWPSIQIQTDSFRLLLPDENFSKLAICQFDGVQGTSNLDYSIARFIVSESALYKVKSSVREKKRPPLPAYQIDCSGVSVWACSLEDHAPSLHPIVGSLDLRLQYSPKISALPLDLFSTPVSKSKVITACGHNLEISLMTPLSVLVTPPGVEIMWDIVQNGENIVKDASPTGISPRDVPQMNTTPRNIPQTDVTPTDLPQTYATPRDLPQTNATPRDLPQTDVTPRDLPQTNATPKTRRTGADPFQFTFTGQTCTIIMATPNPTFGNAGMVNPILFLSTQNPVVVMKSNLSITECTVSVFNMTVFTADRLRNVSATEFFKRGGVLKVNRFFPAPVLDTRQGLPVKEKSGVPPSFLTANYTSDCSSHTSNVLVDFARPVKLSLSEDVLQMVTKFALQVRESLDREGQVCRRREDNAKMSTRSKSESEMNCFSIPENPGEVDGSVAVSTSRLSFHTSQVILEYEGTFGNSRKSASLGWEGLRVCPEENATTLGKFSSAWMKVKNCKSGDPGSYIVMPTSFGVTFQQHSVHSPFDYPFLIFSVSIPNLQVRISQYHVAVVSSFVGQTTKCLSPLVHREVSPENSGTAGDVGKECRNAVRDKTVSFQDDLRNGTLEFMDQSQQDPDKYTLPSSGFIQFYPGSDVNGVMPTMTWKYHEPRCITQISTTPLPFDVSVVQVQEVVELSLSCQLQYYNAETADFVTVRKFHLSESTCSKFNLEIEPSCCQSRVWRVCVMALEWDGIYDSSNDDSKAKKDISTIVSPSALVGCMRVDSVHLLGTVPTLISNVEIGTLDVTILNHYEPQDAVLDGFALAPLPKHPSVEEEVVRFTFEEVAGKFKMMENDGFVLSMGAGRVDGRFVDFQTLQWRHCLCVTDPKLRLSMINTTLFKRNFTHHQSPSSSKQRLEMAQVLVTIGTVLCDFSPSLSHSCVLLLHSWRAVLQGETPQPTIFSHYIIFNNTLEDLHCGQVEVKEGVQLPAHSCHGYSWRIHHSKKQKRLVLSLGSKAGWRWSKPFSISKEGIHHVELPSENRQLCSLFVKVDKISGCQRLVTLSGNWILSSQLPINLQFKLEAVLSSSMFRHSNQDKSTRDTSGDLMGLFPSYSTLPSCLAPDEKFSAVYFAGVRVEDGETWSEPMPLALSKDKWAKPHLLTHIPVSPRDKLQCWYSVTSTDDQSVLSPVQITLAPLFSVRCYLPFDVNLQLVQTDTKHVVEVQLRGFGHLTELSGLSVDVEYNIFMCSDEHGLEYACGGEKSLLLSTKLLRNLPLLKNFAGGRKNYNESKMEWNWTDSLSTEGASERDFVPELVYTFVPTTKQNVSPEIPSGPVVVCLSRLSVGTLVVDIRPQYLLVNRLPVGVGVVFPNHDAESKPEEYYGKEEKVFHVDSGKTCLMSEQEFALQLTWASRCRLSSPKLPCSDAKESKPNNQVFLTGPKGIVGVVSVAYKKVAMTTTVTIKPKYIFHNRSQHKVQVCPFRLSSKALLNFSYEEVHPLTVADPGCTAALLHWQVLGEEQTMRALCVSSSTDVFSWSLPLSLKFVRHSFALPVSEHVGKTTLCLLTCHEQADGCVYLVLAGDPIPRVQVQNLCRYPIDVVEAGSRGIHAIPLTIQPGHQAVYEPPTLAKVYPVVFAEDDDSEDITAMKEKLRNVSVCLRDASDKLPGMVSLGGPSSPISRTSSTSSLNSTAWCMEEWSKPIPLEFAHDRTVNLSSEKKVFVTGFQKPHNLQITILPSGDQSAMCPINTAESSLPSCLVHKQQEVKVDIDVMSLTLQEEQTNTAQPQSILSVTGGRLSVHYEHDFDVASITSGVAGSEDGRGRLEVRLQCLQVDNELEDSTCEYKVLMVPKRKLEWPRSLFDAEEEPLVKVSVTFHCSLTHCVQHLVLNTQPVQLQLEDAMLGRMKSALGQFAMSKMLSTTSPSDDDVDETDSQKFEISVPSEILEEAVRDQFPLMIENLEISPVVLHLNARATVRMYLSCDDLPLQFGEYKLHAVFSNCFEVSQVVASHYTAAAFLKVGWAIGSLEILGSPATWLRSMARGVRDFFTLPYEGITRSPAYFIWGLGQGSTSLVRHVAAGSLRSLASLSSGIGRNVERLSMDERHITDLQQHRSQHQSQQLARGGTLSSGVVGGFTSLGMSIVSAVRGVVDQPVQEMARQRENEDSSQLGVGGTARSIITGVSKGVVGVVTKPVGGAMDFVAHSTEGLRHGLGLSPTLELSKLREEQRNKLDFPKEIVFYPLVRLLNGTIGFASCMTAQVAKSLKTTHQNAMILLFLDRLMVIPESDSAGPFNNPQVFPLTEYCIMEYSECVNTSCDDASTVGAVAIRTESDAIVTKSDAITSGSVAITNGGGPLTHILAVIKREDVINSRQDTQCQDDSIQLWQQVHLPQPLPGSQEELNFLSGTAANPLQSKGEPSLLIPDKSEMFMFCGMIEASQLLELTAHFCSHQDQTAFFSD